MTQVTHQRNDHSVWAPSWVRSIGMATWVTGPDGNICFFNEQAETLFGLPSSECMGLPCQRVIAGMDELGGRFCKTECLAGDLAQRNRQIEPVRMRIRGSDDENCWVWVVHAFVMRPRHRGVWVAHIAFSDDKVDRIERYLAHVVARTPPNDPETLWAGRLALSMRQAEVLRRLAQAEDLRTIAANLCVSHNTVRNCVQHILAKLGVHSVLEAVARYLLTDNQSGEASPFKSKASPDVRAANCSDEKDCVSERPLTLSVPNPCKDAKSLMNLRSQETMQRYEARAKVAKALAHPARMLILDALKDQERCVCELTALVESEQSTVSRHLTVLRNAGLVESRSDGAMSLCRLKVGCLGGLLECVDRVLCEGVDEQQPEQP